jgi:hypothetical protein
MSWTLIKALAPYVVGALLLAALAALVLDRDRLAKLNDRHTACLASVKQTSGAKPLATACDAPIAAAAEAAEAAAACDQALTTGDKFAASQACSGPTKTLIADRDAKASDAANLSGQLAQSTTTCDAAVARASARAQSLVQGFNHAQSILAAAPVGGDGLSVCDADCLRGLAQPGPVAVPASH